LTFGNVKHFRLHPPDFPREYPSDPSISSHFDRGSPFKPTRRGASRSDLEVSSAVASCLPSPTFCPLVCAPILRMALPAWEGYVTWLFYLVSPLLVGLTNGHTRPRLASNGSASWLCPDGPDYLKTSTHGVAGKSWFSVPSPVTLCSESETNYQGLEKISRRRTQSASTWWYRILASCLSKPLILDEGRKMELLVTHHAQPTFLALLTQKNFWHWFGKAAPLMTAEAAISPSYIHVVSSRLAILDKSLLKRKPDFWRGWDCSDAPYQNF
jgi:hypothetical protein